MECFECSHIFYVEDMNQHDGEFYCNNCFVDKFSECKECKKYFNIESLISYGEKYFCKKCHDISHE